MCNWRYVISEMAEGMGIAVSGLRAVWHHADTSYWHAVYGAATMTAEELDSSAVGALLSRQHESRSVASASSSASLRSYSANRAST